MEKIYGKKRIGKGKFLFLQKRLKKKYTAAVIHPDNKTINTILSLIFKRHFLELLSSSFDHSFFTVPIA